LATKSDALLPVPPSYLPKLASPFLLQLSRSTAYAATTLPASPLHAFKTEV